MLKYFELQVSERAKLIKFAMLPNGHLSRVKGSVLIENTTSFDIFIYILLCRTLDCDDFKNEVLKSADPDFVEFIEAYISGLSTKVINMRSVLLAKYFRTGIVNKMKVMCCDSNVWDIGQNIWTSLFKSCLCQTFLNISIEQTVIELFPCNQMHSESFIFILIDESQILPIAEAILVNDAVYVLNAVVQSRKHREKLHFIADIKRSNLIWYRFDNKAKLISRTKRIENTKDVHMLCYIHAGSKSKPHIQEPISDATISTLQNFHTINFNGMNVSVNNSCGPDSLIHVFCCIYRSNAKLFEILNSNDVLLNFLTAYEANNAEKVYRLRIKLLMESGFKLKHVGENQMELDAHSNIASCFDMMFGRHFYSYQVLSECKCGKSARKITFAEVDMTKLIKHGIEGLNNSFIFHNQKAQSTVNCKVCRTKRTSSTEYSPLVFVDIQPIQISNSTLQLPQYSLNEFPVAIQLNSMPYNICAVIEFISGRVRSQAHYTAHILNDGVFQEYNDLHKEVTPSTNQKITAHMLIYTTI